MKEVKDYIRSFPTLLDDLINSEYLNEYNRRNIYRGKNLGSIITDDQKEAIRSGSFKGLAIGDYWLVGKKHYRIMDFNYFKQIKTPATTATHGTFFNHLTMMTDEAILTTYLFSGFDGLFDPGPSYRNTGYFGSDLRNEMNGPISRMIYADLMGIDMDDVPLNSVDVILPFGDNIANNINELGQTLGTTLANEKVTLPTIEMLFGSGALSVHNNGSRSTTDIYLTDYSKQNLSQRQFAATRLNPELIQAFDTTGLELPYWCREPASKERWSCVWGGCPSAADPGKTRKGIRGVFCIGWSS